jgi:hypothetical protein
MDISVRTILTLALCAVFLVVGLPARAVDCREATPDSLHNCLSSDGWKRKHTDDGLIIYSRSHSDSDVREVLATTRIRAPAHTILNTLTDFSHYTDFMPGTLELCEQLHHDGSDYWVFQQLDLPFVSDRYYTIHLQAKHNSILPDWYVLEWTLADESQYQRKGSGQRVKFNNGYWSLREQPDGTTQVLYYIHTDPGRLWSWVVDFANSVAVPDVVNALKRQYETSGNEGIDTH